MDIDIEELKQLYPLYEFKKNSYCCKDNEIFVNFLQFGLAESIRVDKIKHLCNTIEHVYAILVSKGFFTYCNGYSVLQRFKNGNSDGMRIYLDHDANYCLNIRKTQYNVQAEDLIMLINEELNPGPYTYILEEYKKMFSLCTFYDSYCIHNKLNILIKMDDGDYTDKYRESFTKFFMQIYETLEYVLLFLKANDFKEQYGDNNVINKMVHNKFIVSFDMMHNYYLYDVEHKRNYYSYFNATCLLEIIKEKLNIETLYKSVQLI